uniref:guanylate cyclase n=1 Tax=Glossina austeni TaxID=7395 RepID=A0A1A9VS86_GLOAU
MYGMLYESVAFFIEKEFGKDIWKRICQIVDCKHNTFKTHQIYPDKLMPDIAAALAACTGESVDYYMNFFGRCFVRFFSNFGYDRMIRSTGRYYCDFLQSIDNIHLQMRFTYPKMKSPSMQLIEVDDEGAIMLYRSGRTGMSKYLTGQFIEVAKEFYNLDVDVKVLESQNDIAGGTAGPIKLTNASRVVIVKYRLNFDNRDYMTNCVNSSIHQSQLELAPVDLNILLDFFPFTIVLNRDMKITYAGEKIVETWILHNPDEDPTSFIGSKLVQHFKCRRPKDIPMEWDDVTQMRTVLFEFELVRANNKDVADAKDIGRSISSNRKDLQTNKPILLKGPLYQLRDIDSLIYLCSPLIENLEELHSYGLFLNDLNSHGLSRELVMAGWQHCSTLEMMFEKEEVRSDELEKALNLSDSWKKQGDELLYSMIPRPIAERMRNGEESTCQTFEEVSVIFMEIMNLYDGDSSNIQNAMKAVNTLNSVFSAIDEEIISPFIYKVETVGMVYMAVSGAPDINPLHAEHACDLALRLIPKIQALKLPGISIRIGINSGPVVAGVVGLKVPRYCLFGDTVNTASRMESTSEPYKIQLSNYSAEKASKANYKIESRGYVKVKGKGEMETFWLLEGPNQSM